MPVDYSLFQSNVFDLLKNGSPPVDGRPAVSGAEWFRAAIRGIFEKVAKENKCWVAMSDARLDEARILWMDDVVRMRIAPGDTQTASLDEPDHFKQSGHLAYWLRRRIVANAIRESDGGEPTDAIKKFILYGAERCSFYVGYLICLGFATSHLHGRQRQDVLARIELTTEYQYDVAVLLKHKNVSPHALYLIYRSLFYTIGIPPDTTGKVVVL
jgi:hypothetical protein